MKAPPADPGRAAPGGEALGPERIPVRQRWLLLLLLGVVLALAVRPLLRPYQVAGHSTYSDLARAEAFHAAVAGGDLTPRWLPDLYLRHGSPTFNFYAPGAFYAIEILRRAGLGPLWALKAVYLLAWLAGVAGTYRLAAEAVDPDGAVAAAAAFGLAPYLLVDAYVRAGVAEFAAFGLLPVALWAMVRCGRRNGAFGTPAAAVATAALVLTHNITALLSLPLLLALGLAGGTRRRGRQRVVLAVLGGLGLAAFFWLPALAETGAVQARESLTAGYLHWSRHFVPAGSLLGLGGGFAFPSAPGEEVALRFGEALLLGLAAGLGVLALPALRRRLVSRVADNLASPGLLMAAGAGAALCLLMTQAVSAPLWRSLPLLPYVQFPWRFLLPASVLAALGLAALPPLAPRRWRPVATVLLVVLALAGARGLARARYAFHDPAADRSVVVTASSAPEAAADPRLVPPHRFLTLENLRRLGVTGTVGHEFLPVWVEELPRSLPRAGAEAASPGIRVVESGWGYPRVWAEVEAAEAGTVHLNQFYFPGWQAEVDGRRVPVHPEPGRGRLAVEVAAGRHRIEARFAATPVRRAGHLLSLGTMLALALWAAEARRRLQPARDQAGPG